MKEDDTGRKSQLRIEKERNVEGTVLLPNNARRLIAIEFDNRILHNY
jgi:hypothetical protein